MATKLPNDPDYNRFIRGLTTTPDGGAQVEI